MYKLLENLASQKNPPLEINKLNMEQITTFMKQQYDPKTFIIRERFKFWSDMKRKPGETPTELAARIRKKAATCDFASIQNPLDEALRTCFMCSISNEAVLKCLFKMKDDELTFVKAVDTAVEIEESAKAAKETAYGSKLNSTPQANVVKSQPKSVGKGRKGTPSNEESATFKSIGLCYRCDQRDHSPSECKYKDAVCNHCRKPGHI